MCYLQDIKDTKIINGYSDINYFDKKWDKINLYYQGGKYSSNRTIIIPSNIYDFYRIDIDIKEGFYSFDKYHHYLIPRKNNYFLNTFKFTCSCPYFKFKKKCKHLNKYKELYYLSLVLMNKLGYSESRDIINLIYL